MEPPPQGDIGLAEIRREYGRHLALFGNIEITDIENLSPPQFEMVARQTLRDGTAGTGRGFVMLPSASPYGRTITPATLANYQTMVRLVQGGVGDGTIRGTILNEQLLLCKREGDPMSIHPSWQLIGILAVLGVVVILSCAPWRLHVPANPPATQPIHPLIGEMNEQTLAGGQTYLFCSNRRPLTNSKTPSPS